MSLSFNDFDFLPIYKADSAGSRTYPFDHPNHCCNYPKIWTAWFYCTVMCPKGNQSVNAEWRSECPLFAQFARLLSIIISNFSFAGTMMSVLSKKASPSQKYTNHSLRTSSVHILDATQIPPGTLWVWPDTKPKQASRPILAILTIKKKENV